MKVHELLADPAAWCKRRMAQKRYPDGSIAPAFVLEDEACMWCVGGAVRKLYPETGDAVLERLRVALELDAVDGVFIWNDHATHEQMLEVTRRLDV